MDVACNETVLEAQEQINSTIYHLIKMVSMCVSYSLNTMLSVPLPRAPRRSSDTLASCSSYTFSSAIISNGALPQYHFGCGSCRNHQVAPALRVLYMHEKEGSNCCIHMDFISLAQQRGFVHQPHHHAGQVYPSPLQIFCLDTLSMTSALGLYCTVGTALVLPLCYLTILACFCLLCWDMRAGLFSTTRAYVTLTLQAAQTILFSIPVIMGSYLIPRYLHNDAIDIATTITYNLGASLIPLVYGYYSWELQQRIRQAAHLNKRGSQNQ